MPVFEVYATGSYTFTQRIVAATKEEAEEKFAPHDFEICHQCQNEGFSLDDIDPKTIVVDEADEDEDE